MKSFLQRLSYNPLKGPTQKKRGIAILMALTSLMFMVYIASELTRDTAVEYIVNSQEMNRIKAYYASRNSMQIALLRVKLFQQASKLELPENLAGQIDLIWKFPFAWPLPVSDDLNAVDKDTIKQVTSESLMDSTYTHSIEDEGTKIDLNDLASPSKVLREVTKKQILNIFEQKSTQDDDFRTKYQNTLEETVNDIVDWVSDSRNSANGGSDKRSRFSDLGDTYPPNRGFRTIEELKLIPSINEEIYNTLAGRVTIYGMKAINPNTASKEVLLSLDTGMTEEAVKEAIERRDDPLKGGPFKGKGEECLKEFKAFAESRGARLNAEFDKIPMICNKVINFRIKASGVFGEGKFATQKNITAVVFDLSNSAAQIKTFLDKEKQSSEQNPSANPQNPTGQNPPAAGSTSGSQKQEPLPKGPPRIVYWTET